MDFFNSHAHHDRSAAALTACSRADSHDMIAKADSKRLMRSVSWVAGLMAAATLVGCESMQSSPFATGEYGRGQAATSGATTGATTNGSAGSTMATSTPDASAEDAEIAVPIDAAVEPETRSTAPTARDMADRPTTRPDNADLRLYGHMDGVRADLATLTDAASNLLQISFTEEGADFDPEVDPTGEYVVYASTRHRTTSDLYMKRVGGSTVRQLTSDPSNDMMPSFSPDGRYIAYCSDRGGNWDIYILDTQGTGVARQLTRSPSHEIHPTFSPNGDKVVYSQFSQQSGQWEMVILNIEGTPKPSFIGFGLNPVWSPTQDKILFQRARERGTRWFSIWTCDVTPEGESLAFTELASSSNAAIITPDWSPDGQYVTFATVLHTSEGDQQNMTEQPRLADVWLMAADGTGRTMLTGGQFANLQPTWSPTGDILFISDRGQNDVDNIWSVRPQRALQLAEPGRAAPEFTVPTVDATASVPTDQ